MKTLFITLLIGCSLICNAQKTYLAIYESDSLDNVIMYPPGTQFELRNPHNYIVMKYSETPRTVQIDGNYKLLVFPEYQSHSDVYHLTEGRVELAPTIYFGKSDKSLKSIYLNKDELKAHKKLTDSEKKPGRKNLRFELSNGIIFNYKDGNYYAKLKHTYLNIQGKYLIESEIGTLKLSFNPETGKVWWIFEEKEN